MEKRGESPPQYVDWEENEELSGAEMEISPKLQARIDEIRQQTADFCNKSLNAEYADVCNALLEEAVHARLDISRGKVQSWAAGFVYAAGVINFLNDPASDPHLRSEVIAKHFGISQSTMTTKGKDIMDALDAFRFDPRFCLESKAGDNPMLAFAALGLIGRNPTKSQRNTALQVRRLPALLHAEGNAKGFCYFENCFKAGFCARGKSLVKAFPA